MNPLLLRSVEAKPVKGNTADSEAGEAAEVIVAGDVGKKGGVLREMDGGVTEPTGEVAFDYKGRSPRSRFIA